MNEFYTDGIKWKKANSKFTAYLMEKKNGTYVLRGHVNGTPRERDQLLIIPPAFVSWAERAADKYIATGALPRSVGDEVTIPEESLTPELYAALEEACSKYEASIPEGQAPRWFWGLFLGNEDGGSVEWEEATYACLEVYDFDGRHGFDWLNDRLIEAGIAIPGTDAEWEGEGETDWRRCTMYGYDIPLKK